ncbi:helix-turn-helix domain-containing protein [Sansalvadorimonas verongulae]|uniref:helix-turn-helix domain-containing protein n=1 Tax=Sansalvadorimonas verongulae TaxID=2172824 RepID=UPI0012BBBE4A|nr:helix-turn-helix domain-containing protein [Sansalvadorimonas verongulae]MTI12795.1 helix-turn-helix domain-containing protein [Sansalvadorimonas verongulae]
MRRIKKIRKQKKRTHAEREAVYIDYRDGMDVTAITEKHKCNRSSVYRWVHQFEDLEIGAATDQLENERA